MSGVSPLTELAFQPGQRRLYKVDKPIYDDSEPVLQRGPLVDQPLGLDRQTFDEILAETM